MVCKNCKYYDVCTHKSEPVSVGTKVEDLIHECVYFKDPVVKKLPPVLRPMDLEKLKIPKVLESMSYEPPINVILGQIETQIENDTMSVIQKMGVNVDRDELIKALNYDRDQYRKGYNDAKVHAHWIINGDWAECSNCHESSKLAVLEHKDFCGACGAAMDEESVVIHQ